MSLSGGRRPVRGPAAAPRTDRKQPARMKRMPTPATGGNPDSETLIPSHVVPQIAHIAAYAATTRTFNRYIRKMPKRVGSGGA